MNPFRVCLASELPAGSVKIVEVGKLSIGVFNVAGTFYALRNVCPHKLAPLCRGPITGVAEGQRPGQVEFSREGEVVRCPWHGWEFEIKTGRSIFNPHRVRVKTYPVKLEFPECAESVGEADPSVETYPVEVNAGWVTLILPAGHGP